MLNRKLFLRILIVLTIGFIAYLFVFNVSKGEKAPDFEAILVNESNFKLSDLRGKYVLLDFWGSWCPPCRKENPKLVELYKNHNDILTIVTVALEKNKDSGKIAAIKDNFSWTHQIIEENKFVLMSSIARKYGVTQIPTKFLISPEGIVVGELSFTEINELLKTYKK